LVADKTVVATRESLSEEYQRGMWKTVIRPPNPLHRTHQLETFSSEVGVLRLRADFTS
jgi:hypothetical protein